MMEFPTMAQMTKIKSVIAMAGLVGGLAVAGVPAFAQTAAPATPPAAPGSGMMMPSMPNGQAGMPMNLEMMQKMTKMMANCNHMMESMAQEKGGATAPAAPTNKG
jgi:hypothetical protein